MLFLVPLAGLSACATGPVKVAGESDVRCIHRLYDYPDRIEPFQTAAADCAGGRPPDLTGDHYYQVLASSLNLPFVAHEPKRDQVITLTGSRIPQPTSQPASPDLTLR